MSCMSGIFYKNHKWWNYFPVFRRHSQGVGLFSLFFLLKFLTFIIFFSSNLFVIPCKKHTAADLHVPASPWKQRSPVTWHRGAAVIGWQLRVFWPLFFSKHLLPNRYRPLLGEGWSLPPSWWHHHGTGTSSLWHHHAACRSTGGSLHPATVCPLWLASRLVWRDDAVGPDSWCYDLPPSVSLFVSGANAGSTNEVAGNSLNQPITMLDRSKSSNRIWAAPMKDLWSIRP